ncbi:hypothetical protein QG37_04090 [Candidozyma auris]|nr:hypothetical protein QG37_04090 [[Candida] auris]
MIFSFSNSDMETDATSCLKRNKKVSGQRFSKYPSLQKKMYQDKDSCNISLFQIIWCQLAAFRLLHFSKHLPHGRTASYGTFPMHIIKHDNSIHFMGRKNVNPKEETAVGS